MPLTRIRITVEHTGDFFDVLFNPEEYTLNKENTFAAQAVPGLSSPILQFVNGSLATLEMELFFDTYDTPDPKKQDVRDFTGRFTSLMQVDPALHAPPVLVVSWSSLQFRCVLARVSQRFVMFSDDGTPVRARLNVTFHEFIDAEREGRAVKRETVDFSKVHVVTTGETLSAIASRVYDDPRHWRPIAIANGIENPWALVPGQQLIVPSLPFRDPESGEVVH